MIVVSVTYRLGLFGYLATGTGRPANLGLLDQLEAFRWVQRNIAAFGGDPGRVTAFGQSAGGDAVAHLMATPEAPSLFQRAIIQSAPLGITRGREKMSRAMGIAAEAVTEDTPAMEVVAIEDHVSQVARKYGLHRRNAVRHPVRACPAAGRVRGRGRLERYRARNRRPYRAYIRGGPPVPSAQSAGQPAGQRPVPRQSRSAG